MGGCGVVSIELKGGGVRPSPQQLMSIIVVIISSCRRGRRRQPVAGGANCLPPTRPKDGSIIDYARTTNTKTRCWSRCRASPSFSRRGKAKTPPCPASCSTRTTTWCVRLSVRAFHTSTCWVPIMRYGEIGSPHCRSMPSDATLPHNRIRTTLALTPIYTWYPTHDSTTGARRDGPLGDGPLRTHAQGRADLRAGDAGHEGVIYLCVCVYTFICLCVAWLGWVNGLGVWRYSR